MCKPNLHYFENGFSNLLPFAYSRTNEELKELNKSPLYGGTACAEKNDCGGNCMKHTFLEVSWSQCIKDPKLYVYAHTHLIGERKTGLDQKRPRGEKMEFNLMIDSDSSFTMDFEELAKSKFDTKIETISCLPKENAIAKPTTWKIIKGDLKDKHLLVFHLLPPNATRRYEGGENKGALTTKPKCDLFIQFKRPAYEFLQVVPPTTTTSTTTTTRKPDPGTKQPPPSLPPGKTIPTPTPQKVDGTTTNVQAAATEGGSSIVIWIAVVISVVIAVIGLSVVGFCCYRKHQKQKKEEEEEERWEKNYWANAGNNTEIAEQNIKRSVAEKPSLEAEFVDEIFDRMHAKEAVKIEKILKKLYLPALEERGFEATGTFREWRNKNDMFKKGDETSEAFNGRVEKAIAKRDDKSKVSEYFSKQKEKEYFESNAKPSEGKKKKKKGGKKKKESAPDKSEFSDIPTDLLSDAQEKRKKDIW
ncbi:unnamed protein product [Meloidogyne enterolobii]|uniref:Uncharacterized protein n=1 Tax=Meloidogyne enterolobii TaxID=390850 RepID=A0ACB0Y4U1_MELEN